ncbi:MAG TPA: serine/threonine-protein kinase, partial [Kofleriaceae bacterium]|nr:serine/threonine-protein kinase [Kofleriaceae bacterium]
MTCLDDDTVLGLVEGRLAPPMLVELDVHLDSCATCRAVIAQVSRANVVERGRTIGRYVIGDLLGTGTMGRVYAAWEPELDRNVAIKLVRDDSAPARARLLREAQAMAKLAHPNVVTVHEVGAIGDGDDGVFVAMELVDGESLRAWANSQRSWRDRIAMLVEVARGLAAVHAAGVIHRDVKPDNIIIGRDGRARLGDFGLARSETTAIEPTGNTLAVGSSAVAGTPAYMAPEVLHGDAADAASDQFSFGVTAYEIVFGARPFPGRTWAEIAMASATTSPAPLAGPRWIDATIRRCLAVDPARRFPSMQAVALELSSKLARRRPVAWVAAAAIVASAATWLVVGRATHEVGAAEIGTTWSPSIHDRFASQWKANPDAPAALAAVDAWSARWIRERDAAIETPVAARDACLEHLRTNFSALVAGLDASAIAAVDRVVDAVGALGSPVECRTASAGADPVPVDRAERVRVLVGDIATVRAAIALGDARPVLDRTQSLVDAATAAGHTPTLAEALLVRSQALRAVDRFADASVAARDAIAAAERGHDDATAARAWLARVALTGELRALDQADDLAAVAAAAIDRAGAPDRLVAMLARIRGTIAFDRGDLARATELVTHAGAQFAAMAGATTIEVAATDSILGSIARTAGDLDKAESWHREALAIDRELRGPAHPDVARDLHNLAGVLRLRGDLD